MDKFSVLLVKKDDFKIPYRLCSNLVSRQTSAEQAVPETIFELFTVQRSLNYNSRKAELTLPRFKTAAYGRSSDIKLLRP